MTVFPCFKCFYQTAEQTNIITSEHKEYFNWQAHHLRTVWKFPRPVLIAEVDSDKLALPQCTAVYNWNWLFTWTKKFQVSLKEKLVLSPLLRGLTLHHEEPPLWSVQFSNYQLKHPGQTTRFCKLVFSLLLRRLTNTSQHQEPPLWWFQKAYMGSSVFQTTSQWN